MYRKTSPSSGWGGGHKILGMEGGEIGVNCVAWEGGFQQWL